MELLTAAQMRAIEQAAIDSGEVTGLALMERAGAGVVEAIFEWRPELAEGARRAVVLCGPGNNGGDGFVVARLLKQRGWTVEVFLYGDDAKISRETEEKMRLWHQSGGKTEKNNFEEEALRDLKFSQEIDLIIDAILGSGFSPTAPFTRYGETPSHPINDFLAYYNSQTFVEYTPHKTVAIDTPSGLLIDSGKCSATWDISPIVCALTVTFHSAKIGHFLEDGPRYCGDISVKDIGLSRWSYARDSGIPKPVNPRWSWQVDLCSDVKKHARPGTSLYQPGGVGHIRGTNWHPGNVFGPTDGNKFHEGHALIVSGGMAQTGAARLAARGALRIGAGLVTVASPPDALMENAAHLTAIMLQKMKGAEGLLDILSDQRIKTVVIGPGCGVEEGTRKLVRASLSIHSRSGSAPSIAEILEPESRGEARRRLKLTVILDADALTSFADAPEDLFTAIKASRSDVILTPHGGEFVRLFPDIAEKLAEPPAKGPAYSKVEATREAAARSGATVLHKGADTVIAAPDGQCSIAAAVYDRAAPWLATAGSGDVLAGMIAGLAARGISDPAASAAWLHQECGRRLGPGLIAEDIPEAIPAVLKRVLDWEPPSE